MSYTHRAPTSARTVSLETFGQCGQNPDEYATELRVKLAELYKSGKDAVSVFGFKTQFGGGKSTGFALVWHHVAH